jgi:hypothetical protein
MRATRAMAAVVDLCKVGRRELLQRWLDNQLTIQQVWTAAMGAKVCIEEIAAGGEEALVDDDVAQQRVSVCDTCPSRTVGSAARIIEPDKSASWVRSWYCGRALEVQRDGPLPTCGCLVGTETVEKQTAGDGAGGGERIVRLSVLPACATLLSSKACPQAKW